jgi:hypothetical protein
MDWSQSTATGPSGRQVEALDQVEELDASGDERVIEAKGLQMIR